MRTSRLLLLLAAGAVVGFSIFGVMLVRAVDVESAGGDRLLVWTL
jgi:hypothetical protein